MSKDLFFLELDLRSAERRGDAPRARELREHIRLEKERRRPSPQQRQAFIEANTAANARKSPAELVREARARLAAMTPAERRSRAEEAARIASRVRGRGGFER